MVDAINPFSHICPALVAVGRGRSMDESMLASCPPVSWYSMRQRECER